MPSISSSTPKRRLALTTYNQVVNMERPKSYYEVEKDPNLFWDNTRPQSTIPRPSSYDEYNTGKCRPEEYGLPAACAKNKIFGEDSFVRGTLAGEY